MAEVGQWTSAEVSGYAISTVDGKEVPPAELVVGQVIHAVTLLSVVEVTVTEIKGDKAFASNKGIGVFLYLEGGEWRTNSSINMKLLDDKFWNKAEVK